MANKRATTEKAKREPLNMRIKAQLKEDFHVWCIRHKREMTEVVEALVGGMLEGAIPVPAKPKPRR